MFIYSELTITFLIVIGKVSVWIANLFNSSMAVFHNPLIHCTPTFRLCKDIWYAIIRKMLWLQTIKISLLDKFWLLSSFTVIGSTKIYPYLFLCHFWGTLILSFNHSTTTISSPNINPNNLSDSGNLHQILLVLLSSLVAVSSFTFYFWWGVTILSLAISSSRFCFSIQLICFFSDNSIFSSLNSFIDVDTLSSLCFYFSIN